MMKLNYSNKKFNKLKMIIKLILYKLKNNKKESIYILIRINILKSKMIFKLRNFLHKKMNLKNFI